MGDLPDFVSPVDGKVVHGRAGLREHIKRNGVTHTADYKDEWAAKSKERDRFYGGDPTFDSKRRKEALARAFDKRRR